jgi:hypothetical protein
LHPPLLPAPLPRKQDVIEYVMLLRLRPGVAPAAAEDMLDAAWSLQYVAPAIMCASVGAVAAQRSYGGVKGGSSNQGGGGGAVGAGFTHAAHFRLANRAALDALLRNPLHAALLRDTVAPLLADASDGAPSLQQVAFQGRLPRELEGMFRRGGAYAEGTEVLLLMAAAGDHPASQAGSFLTRLAQLAESEAGHAVQASAGEVVECSSSPGVGAVGGRRGGAPSHALMARFPGRPEADAFLSTPPCVAAAEHDARLPLHALGCVMFQVEAGDEGASRTTAV